MNVQETTTRLLEDYDAHRPGTMFEQAGLSLSIQDAYGLQFEVAALRQARGERVAGYKVGCISETMQNQLGIDQPVIGHVWDTEIYPSGAQLRPDQFDGLAIEGELAVRLGEDIPSAAWLKNNPEVVTSHHTCIELHNYVFRSAEPNRAAELITNNTIHAGVVLADADAGSPDFNPSSMWRVDRNTQRLGEAVASHLNNGPVDVVATVSEHLERYGQRLQRGQIVLTGSPLPLWPVAPGDQITVRCDGLADVCCSVSQRH